MSQPELTKIVYLFGAGATHAELANIERRLTSDDRLQRKIGLLTSHLSARVIEQARLSRDFLKDLEFLEPPVKPESVEPAKGVRGAMNIKLLISLIENSKVPRWEKKSQTLKELVRRDIESVLGPRKNRFYLHRALFEMHQLIQDEQLIGLISLNYDDVLDEAYRDVQSKGDLNYCLSLDKIARSSPEVPLLKLHGSFNWRKGVGMRGRKRRVEIIPLGSNKNYLHAPYNFIWTRALEVLVECDEMRVIGCSLSQNDTHLVDLLFKAHLEKAPMKKKSFHIDIIDFEKAGKAIRENYGFFPGITAMKSDPPNPFRTWLTGRASRLLDSDIRKTRYLKKLQITGVTKG